MAEQGGEPLSRLASPPDGGEPGVDLTDLEGLDVDLPIRLAEADALSARALLDYLRRLTPS